MYTCNIAYTAPVNSDSALVLTQEQVWAGLSRKVRHANEFVPVIVGCDVIGEEVLPTGGLVITRNVTFRNEAGQHGKPIKEVCTSFAPSRVDFMQENGTVISNTISKDPEGNLMMSYTFQWRHDDIDEGSEEAELAEEKHWKLAKMAVHGSIDTIREMVKQGSIT